MGETRWGVRPCPAAPRSCDCSSSARWPGANLSGFMARHMLQPGSRHSRPASVKTLSSPSASAWRFDQSAAGHDHRSDAGRRRDSRGPRRRPPQVLDPAVGAGADEDAIDGDVGDRLARGAGPCSARRGGRLAIVGVGELRRIGNPSADSTTWPGLVPQVTCGSISPASKPRRGRSGRPGRWEAVLQRATAASKSCGERSAAKIFKGLFVGGDHARPAPASIVMLQTVIRSSISGGGWPRRCIRCSSRCRRWW